MGLLFNSAKEISDKVYERFGDRENYLLAMKHNDFKMGLLKLLASKLYYAWIPVGLLFCIFRQRASRRLRFRAQ